MKERSVTINVQGDIRNNYCGLIVNFVSVWCVLCVCVWCGVCCVCVVCVYCERVCYVWCGVCV